ncbi:retropepsin-like aspartic protease family protein [Methylobacterium oryzisoli]|uniref:retropepsin-like aspartic protease family protein n=1 Tax=Methylobacterium oryzisoli TaxID=3385502 RepID=UPI003892BC85
MTRPLHWAFGVLAGAVALGGGTAERVAHLFGQTPAPAAAAVNGSGAGTALTVTLHQDLAGHYTVHPLVEGRRVRMMVDTGATLCAFTQDDAERAGIRLDPRAFTKPMGTANGVVRGAPVRIAEMQVGGITVRDVEAVVLPRGRLGTSLLGMSFLRRLRGFEVEAGRLTLRG